MVAGFERYFQIARCFRDEDLRADRQPEFTQLDLEMSFVEQEDILQLDRGAVHDDGARRSGPTSKLPSPFPRLTYAESMATFGTDKPDLRFGLELASIADVVQRRRVRRVQAGDRRGRRRCAASRAGRRSRSRASRSTS